MILNSIPRFIIRNCTQHLRSELVLRFLVPTSALQGTNTLIRMEDSLKKRDEQIVQRQVPTYLDMKAVPDKVEPLAA